MRYIVDASVLVKAALPETGSDLAKQLLDRHRDNLLQLVAPDFILLECASVFWKRISLTHEIAAADAEEALSALRSTAILLYPAVDFLQPALRLAVKHRHPIDDSIYVAMAIDLNCGFITADKRLAKKFGSPPVYLLEKFRL